MPLLFQKRIPSGAPVSSAFPAARSVSSLNCRLCALKLCYRHLSRAHAAPPLSSFDCCGCLPNSFVIICRAPGPRRHPAVLFRRLSKAIASPPCCRWKLILAAEACRHVATFILPLLIAVLIPRPIRQTPPYRLSPLHGLPSPCPCAASS